jgi:hypothetical protein
MLAWASPAVSVSRRADLAAETEVGAVGAGSAAAALAALGRPDGAPAAGWAQGEASTFGGRPDGLGTPGSPFAVEPGRAGIAPARLTWTNPLADPSPPSASTYPEAAPAAGPALPSTTAGDTAWAASGPPSAPSSPTVSRSVASRSAAPRSGLRIGPALTATVAGTPGRPVSQLPVRPASSASAPGGPAGQAWDAEPVVARAVTIDEVEVTPEASGASVESGAAAAASAPAASGGAGTGSTPAAAAAGAAGSEAARDQETQAWADRLYDRISLRLRRDLLVERERSGALVDRGF